MLHLETRQRRRRAVRGQDLGVILHGHSLRLAILNSCLGATSGGVHPFSGVAQSLIQIGLPAVVAMQTEITNGAAVLFAEKFYQSVAEGLPVDLATVRQGGDVVQATG